jgi:predicted AAA+ superfamily ATPase
MIKREIEQQMEVLSKAFPVIAITGARQTGKTTFLKYYFPDYKYYNLETPSTLAEVEADPKAFIHQQSHIIIDEIQRFPDLISYIQEVVDERKKMADFIISGSESLSLSEKISQSLAGRAGYLKMFPFSFSELTTAKKLDNNFKKQILNGFMPALYDRNIPPTVYYDQYIATYLERDLRQLSAVHNLNVFRKFLALLAGRIGQLSNFSSLSNDVGVDVKTIERRISILEASYLIFQLQPYYENFGKRYIKSSKIYFADTGLVCRLLGIDTVEELENHYLIGNLFENLIILNMLKDINNKGKKNQLYFFRDSNQNEVDVIIDKGTSLIPIEIKSSSTFSHSFFS